MSAMALTEHAAPETVELWDATARAAGRFVEWLSCFGWESHDQYDFWACGLGRFGKRIYYSHGAVGVPFVAPLVLTDLVWPSSRRLLFDRKRFPIADAHFAMGFAKLHAVTGDSAHLATAEALCEYLHDTALPGYSGLCWGYPFDWETKRGLWKRGIPFITSTPYVFDAFVDLHRATGKDRYLGWAASVARFVADDIRHMETAGSGKAASYTPSDDAWVLNASAYRAACLAEASVLFEEPRYRTLAEENTRFILEQQRQDGSWVYSASDPNDQFIDHFHTCFVLKGLWRTYRVVGDEAILSAILRGFDYYQTHLFHVDGTPRPFAPGYADQFRHQELYDFAEAINLFILLRRVVPEADTKAEFLVREVVERWVATDGHFVTRRSRGGFVNRVPYHRWAQAQMFRSLVLWLQETSRCAA